MCGAGWAAVGELTTLCVAVCGAERNVSVGFAESDSPRSSSVVGHAAANTLPRTRCRELCLTQWVDTTYYVEQSSRRPTPTNFA